MIEDPSDKKVPIRAGIACPYCHSESQTTLPTKDQVSRAEFRIMHECPGPWVWEVTTQ